MCPVDVSIIVACEEEQQQLRQLLPQLLSLRYERAYEVIVVDKLHDKDMEEWLEEMEVLHPNLCHTFCSTTARGLDIHKLALTLGAKAASYEWLAILPVDVKLQSGDWLEQLAACCDEETVVAVGITNRKRRLNRFTSFFYRRRFSLFRPTSSAIFCRRSSLLQGEDVKSSNCKVVKL